MVYSNQHLLMAGVFLIGVLLLVVVSFVWKRHAQPYEQIDSILSSAEQHFYTVLMSVIKDRAHIMVKVRIADLIKVKRSVSKKAFWKHFSKISQKHIDFVLVDPVNFKTICLIELDDKSHLQPQAIMRDRFVNNTMAQTGIPLFRFSVRRRYDRSEIIRVLSATALFDVSTTPLPYSR